MLLVKNGNDVAEGLQSPRKPQRRERMTAPGRPLPAGGAHVQAALAQRLTLDWAISARYASGRGRGRW